jgi:ChrR-like protein with cupin domain
MDDAEYWRVPDRFQAVADMVPDATLSYFLLGADDESTPTAIVFQMEPGFVINRHAHEAARFEVVVKGSIDVGDRVLHPGDVMTAEAGELYGPKVAGPDGCTTIEVFSTRLGAEATLYELTDGTTVRRDLLAGEPLPDGIVGAEWAATRRAEVLDGRAGE